MHQGHCQCESVVVQGFRALHVAAVWGEKRKDRAVVSASRLAAGKFACPVVHTSPYILQTPPICPHSGCTKGAGLGARMGGDPRKHQ